MKKIQKSMHTLGMGSKHTKQEIHRCVNDYYILLRECPAIVCAVSLSPLVGHLLSTVQTVHFPVFFFC